MASAFETGIETAGTTVQGYFTTALPTVMLVAAAGLVIKYGRKFVRGL